MHGESGGLGIANRAIVRSADAVGVGTKVLYALEHDSRRGRKVGIVVVEAFALMKDVVVRPPIRVPQRVGGIIVARKARAVVQAAEPPREAEMPALAQPVDFLGIVGVRPVVVPKMSPFGP